MKYRYKISPGSVHSLTYCAAWCTKYRKKVLVNEIIEDLRFAISQKAVEIGVEIVGLEINPDHVIISISINPIESVHNIIRMLKGAASNRIRSRHEDIRKKLPCLWSRNYYVVTTGYSSQSSIANFVESQKGK